MIAIHQDKSFKVKVTELGKDTFKGIVIESDMKVYQIHYYGILWVKDAFTFEVEEEVKEVETNDLKAPKHYDNTNGSLYKFSNDRGWNTYLFEIVKRVERAEKKGEFISDIKKSIHVLELYLKEQGHRFKNEIEPLNK
jgi:hypothetical protein